MAKAMEEQSEIEDGEHFMRANSVPSIAVTVQRIALCWQVRANAFPVPPREHCALFRVALVARVTSMVEANCWIPMPTPTVVRMAQMRRPLALGNRLLAQQVEMLLALA